MESMCRAVAFSLGLATTLAALGIVSTYVGKAYGQIGSGLPIAVSLIAIVMGLNLLEAVQLPLPSLDVDVRNLSMSPLATVRKFLFSQHFFQNVRVQFSIFNSFFENVTNHCT